MSLSLENILGNFSALPSYVSRITVNRPKVKRLTIFAKKLAEYLQSIILKVEPHRISTFWISNNFPKFLFHDFEKLARGIERDLFWGLICGKSIGDSRKLMKPFSLPYECIFYLACFGFSPNAQFFHRKIFEDSSWYTLVLVSNDFFWIPMLRTCLKL